MMPGVNDLSTASVCFFFFYFGPGPQPRMSRRGNTAPAKEA
jgi:hypothetical protein